MSETVNNVILQALRQVLSEGKKYPLHVPHFDADELALVSDCVQTGWVSSVGSYVDQFERDLAEYTGAKYAVVTVNGTAALHMAYMLAGVVAGDEVLCPALTFVATANAIAYCGASPHFIDSDPARLSVCPEKLAAHLHEIAVIENGQTINKQTRKPIRALVVMHVFGHPADMDALQKICDQYHIALIEDAAESLGSYYHGKHSGGLGKLGVFSFNGNKIITTGGGGAIVTNNEALAKRAKHLTTTAKLPHAFDYVHDEIGYNYRMPNINAALGVAQLKKMPLFLAQKRKLAAQYRAAFADISQVQFIDEPADSRSNYWLNALLFDTQKSAESFLIASQQAGIFCRPCWRPMHQLPAYQNCPRADLSQSENIAGRLVNIPSTPGLAA
jgi:perosamine synthetase